jgi:hypothetical protein
MRNWTTGGGLVLGFIAANLIGMRSATAEDLKHTIAEIDHHAERVFKLLDKDQDGTIAGDELKNLVVRVQRELKTLRNKHVIGGTVRLAPVAAAHGAVLDRNGIKLPEFTAAFLATAAQCDAEIRMQRVVRARVAAAQWAANEAAINSAGGRSTNKDDDDDRDRRKHKK